MRKNRRNLNEVKARRRPTGIQVSEDHEKNYCKNGVRRRRYSVVEIRSVNVALDKSVDRARNDKNSEDRDKRPDFRYYIAYDQRRHGAK